MQMLEGIYFQSSSNYLLNTSMKKHFLGEFPNHWAKSMSWIWPFSQSPFKLFPIVQVTGSRIRHHNLPLKSE